ncbi:MAG: hypothetical protein WCV88_01460 [Patescibacteria group bacterium]|jgi:hypothetical protein
MGKVVQFPTKGAETEFEKRLKQRQEGKGAISLGETAHVAEVSTGEQVEIDPVRFNSVWDIYKVIERNFKNKDSAGREQALGELQKSLGVEVTVANETTPDEAAPDTELKRLIHKLAEDIYDALENCRDTIAAIKPETIGGKTVSRLDQKGDANFVVAAGKGKELLSSMKQQNGAFDVVHENNYGFVLENKQVGFRVMFIYQERLNQDGSPKTLEEIKDDTTPDEDTNADSQHTINTQAANNNTRFGTQN